MSTNKARERKRSNDPLWAYVERVEGRLKCMFCKSEFAGTASIWRFKWHFSGVEGRGINVCDRAPGNVKEEAKKAIESTNKRLKTIASSSYVEARQTVPTTSPKQTNEAGNGTGDVQMAQTDSWMVEQESTEGRGLQFWPEMVEELRSLVPTFSQEQTNEVQIGQRGMALIEAHPMEIEMGEGGERENLNGSMTEDLIQPNETRNCPNEPVFVDAVENIGNALQTTKEDLMTRAIQMNWNEINSLLMEDLPWSNGRESIIAEWTQPIETSMPGENAQKTRGVALQTTKLVGQAFEMKKNEILSLLMNNEILSIGVCGMGGVGKTLLMRHIHNQLLKWSNSFTHVYWITVSQDATTYKLQDRIAKAIKLDLSNEDEEAIRATKLHDELNEKHKFLLILDDLWDYFDANEVGIPISMNGCKMIFTTRSRKICQQMCACEKNIIKVEPLSKEEAWTLFTMELGDYNIEFEPLAKAIARECAGLPLGLKTMARSMRGVDDMSEWRYVLEELKEAEKRDDDMEPRVFRVLRYSYDRLKDLTTQECFLYCAFFPEDFMILREELIEYLIVEGIIEGKNWHLKYDKGHVILNKLENACLLEVCRNYENDRCVRMHDLIRDMAIQKLRERSSVIVKAGAQLKQVPSVDEWTDSLVRVSLMGNHIKEIPSGHSPRCPKLSTLLMASNKQLRSIADSFFQQLHGLTVLDLSNTRIVKLPDSISKLVSLVTLLLSRCSNLKYIPSLAKLSRLQNLDLSKTGLEKLPEGMELQSNLRYLNLWESEIKELRIGILPNFSHLQVLILNKFGGNKARISVAGKEVGCLRKLESLECYFEGFFDFRECMEHLSLCTYNIGIGQFDTESLHSTESKHSVLLNGCCLNIEQDFKSFPKDIEELVMVECRLPKTLFGDSSLRWLMKLKIIHLNECDGIKSLVSLPCTSSGILKSLETLLLSHLNNFRGVISGTLQSVGLFSCLKSFDIGGCHRVKRLFPIGLLSTLQNIESIRVSFCFKLEEIQATEEEEEEEDDDDDDDEREEDDDDDDDEESHKGEKNSSNNHNLSVELIRLPKLTRLELKYLPKLKSICSGVMICDSLEQIDISYCTKLKRIPVRCSFLSLERIKAYPKEWWEIVEWDQLTDKNLLQPFLEFL